MGLTWALGWFGAGMGLLLVGLAFGATADVPFPILFGLLGFVAGTAFSGVLGIAEGRRRFDEMSLPRFARWGAMGGLLLTALFVSVTTLAGEVEPLQSLHILTPVFMLAGAGSATGASLHFYAPENGVSGLRAAIEIRDASGTTVRTLSSGVNPGINRVQWDLREEASRSPKLRTPPLEHEHVDLHGNGWRPPPEGGRVRPTVAPGQYAVSVTIGEWSATTELEVLRDPNAEGSESDIRAQVAMLRDLRDETNQVTDLIDEIEWVRKSLDDVQARIEADALRLRGVSADTVLARSQSVDDELIELEMQLFDLRLTGGSAGQDSLRWPRQLYAKLISLAGYISGTDHRPTDQADEVHEVYQERLRDVLQRMEEIRAGSLSAFNRLLAEGGVATIS